MNEHDLMLLAEGIAIGALLMLLLEMAIETRTNRRQRKLLTAAEKRLSAQRAWRKSLAPDVTSDDVVRALNGTAQQLPSSRLRKDDA